MGNSCGGVQVKNPVKVKTREFDATGEKYRTATCQFNGRYMNNVAHEASKLDNVTIERHMPTIKHRHAGFVSCPQSETREECKRHDNIYIIEVGDDFGHMGVRRVEHGGGSHRAKDYPCSRVSVPRKKGHTLPTNEAANKAQIGREKARIRVQLNVCDNSTAKGMIP